ncbi:MAG TPA: antibiotic biosynthesis monooxygenase [Pseudonocardiaceae bacterium]|nr:antibiotic biosynthesis monooxygenase [Pseudonocardiaceae bacterium]
MLLICRFTVEPAEAENFMVRARRALSLLTAQPGCRGGQLGRAPDEVIRWVLVVHFDSVVAYRRALSPFDVREHVIPLLSEALTSEPGAYEVLAGAERGEVTDHGSLLAGAADQATRPQTRRGNAPGAR